jgi:hypothetical protein
VIKYNDPAFLDNVIGMPATHNYNPKGIKVTLSNAWAQDPSGKHQKRLGAQYARYVPPNGKRIVVPDWYNA